jgi:hypothetical protein
MALGYYGVIREYGWRRVAFIVQDEGLFTVVSSESRLIHIMSYRTRP